MGVVDCLIGLSKGDSYAKSSLVLREAAERAREHAGLHDGPTELEPEATPATGPGDQQDTGGPSRSESWRARQGRSAWHLAADLVEQYSPVLFAELMRNLHDRERALVEAGSDARSRGELPAKPITYVLDEIPILVRLDRGPSRIVYTLFAVSEVWWRPPRQTGGPLRREHQLRLVRAFPGTGTPEAWWLVFAELGTVPDVVVSDFAGSIQAALREYYAGHHVTWLPSLFHFDRGIRDMFGKVPEYSRPVGKASEPLPQLLDHLNLVSRDWLVENGVDRWIAWWDEFEQLATSAGAPGAPIRARRDIYRDSIAAVIPTLAAHPHLPASNSGIENKARNELKDILRNRSQRYGNVARLNGLLDLVTCADNRLLRDRLEVAQLLRDDNLADDHGGWATRMRTYDDRQPPLLMDDEAVVWDHDPTSAEVPVVDPFTLPTARTALLTPTGVVHRRRRRRRYASLRDAGLVPSLIEARLFSDEVQAQP